MTDGRIRLAISQLGVVHSSTFDEDAGTEELASAFIGMLGTLYGDHVGAVLATRAAVSAAGVEMKTADGAWTNGAGEMEGGASCPHCFGHGDQTRSTGRCHLCGVVHRNPVNLSPTTSTAPCDTEEG